MPPKNQNQNQIVTIERELCKRCNQIQPITFFSNPGILICKNCEGAPLGDGSNQDEVKRKARELAVNQIMSAITRQQIDVPHTSELASKVVEKLGGVDTLAERYVEVVTAILDKDPSTRLALSAVEGIAKLIRDSTLMRDSAPDVNNISDEALEVELNRFIEQKMNAGKLRLESNGG